MKFINILIAMGMLFLPCLYYVSSGLVSVGYEMAKVMGKSYTSFDYRYSRNRGAGNQPEAGFLSVGI